MIVGISGLKRSGKDTFASFLLEHHAMRATHAGRRIAFADPLKVVCADLFDLSPAQLDGALKEAVDPRWGLSPRQILQRFGTEGGRSVHPDVWIRYVMRQIDADPGCLWVVTDVRFANEARTIRERGGMVVRVDRPGLVSDGHASEALDFEPDVVINNDGSLEDLRAAAWLFANRLR